MSSLDDQVRSHAPRAVTYPELKRKLWPYIVGYAWAKDTLWDLWKMGAPVPQDKCPGNVPCKQYPKCMHIRRVLYPTHFEKWWADIAERQGSELVSGEILGRLGN
jgi:hypothetical protein